MGSICPNGWNLDTEVVGGDGSHWASCNDKLPWRMAPCYICTHYIDYTGV